jgi:hypothetical protein
MLYIKKKKAPKIQDNKYQVSLRDKQEKILYQKTGTTTVAKAACHEGPPVPDPVRLRDFRPPTPAPEGAAADEISRDQSIAARIA